MASDARSLLDAAEPRDAFDGEPAWLTPAETMLMTVVLLTLAGNLPAIALHKIAGVKSVPIWPIYLAMYGGIGMLVTTRRFGAALDGLPAGAAMLAFSLLPLVSIVWSVLPAETALHALTLAGTAFVGFALAACMPATQALRILAMFATLAPCIDLVLIGLVPSVGIEQDGPWVGTWRGMHEQKNGLGAHAALYIVLLLAHVRAARQLEAFALLGLALNLFLLVAAKSTTSWLTAAVCLPLMLAPRALSYVGGRLFQLAFGALALAMLFDGDIATDLLQALPGLVGKDSTLSNRLPVWAVLQPYIEARPWLGYGYGAFWSDAFMPGEVFMAQIKFLPGSAHSSIVETRLSLGVVGLVGLGIVTVQYIVRLWRIDAPSAGAGAGLVAPIGHALFAFLILQSLTESVLLTRNDLVWALAVWLATRIGMTRRELRV